MSPALPDAAVDRASRDAARAARSAAVLVRTAESVAELRAVADLFARIWDAPATAPMPHDVMRSLAHAGGAVHAAYRDGRLLGASVAVFGPPSGASSYSLIAGVDASARSRGAGFALKLAQRAWALAAGARSMAWTYDPLLRRNAHFNLGRLGASVSEYLVDFYGEIDDGVNDPETDRLAVTWDLLADLPSRGNGAPGQARAPDLLAPGADDGPAPGLAALSSGEGRARCWIPDDMLTVRRRDQALARRWRLAVRDTLGAALGQGWRVAGFADPGWYLLARTEDGR